MTPQNYYPWPHQGISMKMSSALDPNRLYSHPTKIKLSGIALSPLFNWPDLPTNNYYGEYLVLMIGEDIVDTIIDYNIIISLN